MLKLFGPKAFSGLTNQNKQPSAEDFWPKSLQQATSHALVQSAEAFCLRKISALVL